MEVKKILKQMTLEEKCNLLCGYKNTLLYPVEHLGIRSLRLSDGPNGLRMEDEKGDSISGIANVLPATCFPSGVTMASTWNKDLLYKVGEAMSHECKHYGVNVVLGPAINIKRNPLCGRNFEYYSEDPIVAGKLSTEFVKGLQDNGIGSCPKHFACNNNETYRFVGDSVVDDRAWHEIYLKPFELLVKSAKPYAMMTAYNKINGVHCSENELLQNSILRDEWGFDGVSMTDWGGILHRDLALTKGCDLEMPGQVPYNVELLINGVKNGTLDESDVDTAVERILTLLDKTDNKKVDYDFNKSYEVAKQVALEGSVLLKNDGTLPLSESEEYIVVGGFFDNTRYQGCGSALLNPFVLTTHKDAFDKNGIKYQFIQGYDETSNKVNKRLENQALEQIASSNKTVIFFGGLSDYIESEGFDRDNMHLPSNQESLFSKILALGKKVVFVLHGGSANDFNEIDKSNAVLNIMLSGEAVGDATFDLLFGKACPSGKLTETWPNSYSDVPFGDKFISSPIELYKESIFVGYRYYLSNENAIRYPFGYGLSYTSFEYSNIAVSKQSNSIDVSFDITNTGKVKGKEIAEVYLSHNSALPMPIRELKGFAKVELSPSETKHVSINIPFEDIKVYYNGSFVLEGGNYKVEVGASSVDIKLSNSIYIDGEKLQKVENIYYDIANMTTITDDDFAKFLGRDLPKVNKKPYTLETPIKDIKSLFGIIFCRAVVGVGKNQYKKACKIKDKVERERKKKAGIFVMKLMPNNCIRSMCFSSSGALDYKTSCALVEFANNHYIKGIKILCKK